MSEIPVSYSSFYKAHTNAKDIVIKNLEIKVFSSSVVNICKEMRSLYQNPIMMQFDGKYMIIDNQNKSYVFYLDLLEYDRENPESVFYRFRLVDDPYSGGYFESYSKTIGRFADFLASKNIDYRKINKFGPDLALIQYMKKHGYKNLEEIIAKNKPVSYSSLFGKYIRSRDIIVNELEEKIEIKVLPDMFEILEYIENYYQNPILMMLSNGDLLLSNRSKYAIFNLHMFDDDMGKSTYTLKNQYSSNGYSTRDYNNMMNYFVFITEPIAIDLGNINVKL